MMNLAVTTRQWNSGDDFILNGIKNLYPEDACWAVYNRNPDNKLVAGNHWTGQSLDLFDRVVVAGSPQWYGGSVEKLFQALRENPRPIYFYGIGVGETGQLNLSGLDLEILRMAKRIVTRGNECQRLLAEHNIDSESEVCPALFSQKYAEPFRTDRVGCVLTAKHAWRLNVDDSFEQRQVELFKKFGDEVIIHHLEELEFAKRHFSKVWYAYDPRDYKRIYDRFGVIVSSRLHGAVFGMSLGKPAFLIDTESKRCQDAASKFEPLEFCGVYDVERRIQEIDLAQRAREIVEFKEREKVKYSRFV